jgi:hypothetical protein
MKQKVGIGVVTTNYRPKIFQESIINIIKNSVSEKYDIQFSIVNASVGDFMLSVAQAKNQNLFDLQGCDYIFLFDDDCFPYKAGYIDFFVNAHLETKQHHFLYCKKGLHTYLGRKQYTDSIQTELFADCGGVFMFITKQVIERVGGMNVDYIQWGFEHAGYSARIHKAGLCDHLYQTLENTDKYLSAKDYESVIQSNIPLQEKQNLISINKPVFEKDCETIYQPIKLKEYH